MMIMMIMMIMIEFGLDPTIRRDTTLLQFWTRKKISMIIGLLQTKEIITQTKILE